MSRFRVKPECGTRSGYDYHVRQVKEEPCDNCTEALRKHWREQRAEKGLVINTLRRIWRAQHPEAVKANSQMSKRRRGQGDWTIKQLLETHGTSCHLCGKAIDLTAPAQVGAKGWELSLHPDHIIPLSKGGSDTMDNVRPAHARCNIRKWATVKDYE